MFGPIIEGERIRLEPPTLDMIPVYIRWFADTDVTRFLEVRFPPSEKMEEEWLERMARSENDVIWTLTADGRAVGSVGIHGIDWRNGYGHTGTVIGEKAAWGQGYGSEVAYLRTRYAFMEVGLRKLQTGVYAGNEASCRMLEKVGYKQYGLARQHVLVEGEWRDVWLGEVLRDEWLEAECR